MIVQSVADAVAATEGGADRLEVVRDIQEDGLTPEPELVRAIAAATPLPLRVMVRESNSFGAEQPGELARLQRAFAAFADIGVDGAVVGFAREGRVDAQTTSAVLGAAPSLRATFHRAFDSLPDPFGAIDVVRELPNVDRILTSGGAGDWPTRIARLRDYVARAGHLAILVGGGVDDEGVRQLAASGSVREVHVGRAACEPQQPGAPVSASRVRVLRQLANSNG